MLTYGIGFIILIIVIPLWICYGKTYEVRDTRYVISLGFMLVIIISLTIFLAIHTKTNHKDKSSSNNPNYTFYLNEDDEYIECNRLLKVDSIVNNTIYISVYINPKK